MNDYTTKTASLLAAKIKGTKADVTYLNIDGTPFSKVVTDHVPETPTPNDIWKYAVTTDENGVVTITDDVAVDYSEMTSAQKAITQTAAKVIDNKVLDADGQLLMNWDTKNFTNIGSGWKSWMNSIFGGSYSQKPPITEWDSDLSSLTNGIEMFSYTSLASFDGDLSNLTKGDSMFYESTLESFNEDLSSLTYGNYMFAYTALQSFNLNLPNLTNGFCMFKGCSKLTSFSGDLRSLTYGANMFDVCSNLTSFSGDLSSLTNGSSMFDYCSKLTSFSGDLSSLTNGSSMFDRCKLNAESVHTIIHFINPNVTSGTITIGTNIINDSTTLEAQKLEFAKTCLCDSWEGLNAEFTAKKWTVTWQFNGTATSTASTLELTDSNISTALWAKLEEVTEDNEHYGYVSEEDGKHYNINWFHETNGSTEGYEYFGSLLEACGAFGVIPKEYAESNN